MFSTSAQKFILILEPNLDLEKPYAFLDPKIFNVTRISNPLTAAYELEKQPFDLVFLSCSFSNKKIVNFLESLKQASTSKIIPLALVVDFSQSFSIVPGLTWDNKLSLLSSVTSVQEFNAVLNKLL